MGSGTANTQETQSSTGQSKEQRQLCEQTTPDTPRPFPLDAHSIH